MGISQIDRSNYYRGLLVLTGKDRIIDPREREMMLRFGKVLDFDKRFCEAAIDDVLENKYLNDEPVIFDDRKTAECFLRDGIRLAFVDESLHPKELAWLRSVAKANKVNSGWLDAEIQRHMDRKACLDPSSAFEIESHLGE